MLVYRIEDENGSGPFRGYYGAVSHAEWFLAPAKMPSGWEIKHSVTMFDSRGYDYDRYRYVFAMESLQAILDVFRICGWGDEETTWISVYEVDSQNVRVLYSVHGCSRQIVFDRDKAELKERFQVSNSSFCSDLFDSCPQYLCR